MTREEAVVVLTNMAKRLSAQDNLWGDEAEAIDTAIAALRGPIPDHATGLVPCGCGGKAEFAGCSGDADYYSIVCPECAIDTDSYAVKEDARDAWNRAMGWRVER